MFVGSGGRGLPEVAVDDFPAGCQSRENAAALLVWHVGSDGKFDRVVNLSGDQHQMDTFILKPLPARLIPVGSPDAAVVG
jgi:hypothetical protein